ncbi:MAG: hypothetical protein Q8P97_02570 [bacterium]|nr:hypothetical protein [bacterium]
MLYNKNNLAVAKFCARDGYKPEIAGVYFTKEKTCATDAIILLEMSVDSSQKVEDYPKVQKASAMRGFKPFIVSKEWISKVKIPQSRLLPILNNVAVKHIKKDKVEFMMTEDATTAQIFSVPRVEGKFPDYEDIFPKGKPVAQFSINGEKFAELLKVMSGLPLNKKVKVSFYGAEKPVVLEAGNDTQRSRGMISVLREN